MFSIPYTFSSEEESYITIPALKRFAKEKKNEDLTTTVDRAQLIRDIESYANKSDINQEIVLNWIDQVVSEGIKEVQIKYVDDSFPLALLSKDDYVSGILESFITDKDNRHLCGNYSADMKLYRYDIDTVEDYGKRIRLYLGKLLCMFDKKNGERKSPYPILVDVFLDAGLIVARCKSKSGMYKHTDNFDLASAISTTAEKELSSAISFVCGKFGIETLHTIDASGRFKSKLFFMLNQYTQTPEEINELIESKKDKITSMVNLLIDDICGLPRFKYEKDVISNINNMVEKYFSISYSNKSVFTNSREAYPLRLIATDEEDSRVEQTAAAEKPLQSKALFFDNKKMLQKNKTCDGVLFMYNRINPIYCTKQFKVKVVVKRDFCSLKFTEYTMEEDIIHVLFSLIYNGIIN